MKPLGWAIVVVALIWAAAILATAQVLGASADAPRVARILTGGAVATILLLGGFMRGIYARGKGK